MGVFRRVFDFRLEAGFRVLKSNMHENQIKNVLSAPFARGGSHVPQAGLDLHM